MKIKNKLVYDWGINDIRDSSKKIYYRIWRNMIARVHCETYLIKNPTYRKVTIDKKWKYLSNFRDWFVQANYTPKYVLDKDLFIPESKIYSAHTCLFLPAELNQLIITKSIKGYTKTPAATFKSEIYTKGNSTYLGTFNTEKEAHQAYIDAKVNYFLDEADKWININDKIFYGLYRHASLLQYGTWEYLPCYKDE